MDVSRLLDELNDTRMFMNMPRQVVLFGRLSHCLACIKMYLLSCLGLPYGKLDALLNTLNTPVFGFLRQATLSHAGGSLRIRWPGPDNVLKMTGPAEHVYDGHINL